MAQPIWLTPAGNLGTYPENVFFQVPLLAEDPDSVSTVYFQTIAGELPGGVEINANGLIVGIPKAIAGVQGVPTTVSRNVVSKFAVRAYTTTTINNITVINRLADRTFSITIAGQDSPKFTTPAGEIAQFYDGTEASVQLEISETDPTDEVIFNVIGGQLPLGMTLDPLTGVISGIITPLTPAGSGTPGFSVTNYDQYPFDITLVSINQNYQFAVEVTDGKESDVRNFSIFVYSKSTLTADNTQDTADNTFITADVTPEYVPIITTPEGYIGSTRADNWYAFKFDAITFSGQAFEYILDLDGDYDIPPGLELDPTTGWLYGYIPDSGLTENSYTFAVKVRNRLAFAPTWNSLVFYGSGNIVRYGVSNYTATQDVPVGTVPTNTVYWQISTATISRPYVYSLTTIGQLNTEITWLTPSSIIDRSKIPSPLGTIVNGSTSTLFVKAVSASELALEYRLAGLQTGDDPVYNLLPQGLTLLPSGNIVGRCSFNTFALDGGTTTFDVNSINKGVTQPTTFDMTFVFTVEAYTTNNQVNITKQFSIIVDRQYNQPYENLYIQAMPPEDDRQLIKSLLQNPTIIPPNLLYRGDDPNFGRASGVVYDHAFGLTAATYAEYVSSLYLNHYWKNLVLGSIETAQATDAAGNVIYEVVYSKIIDDLINNDGQSVGKEVVIPYPIDPSTPDEIDSVFPNSLPNMRDQVIDTVGQISNLLPQWMLSTQSNGRVLGFTPAWVIAYVLPGQSGQIAYNIREQFGTQLNLIDFEVDRYELDRALTNNWDPVYDQWIPQPPAETTFDVDPGPQTIFDDDSLRFITPVSVYLDSDTTIYNKYLVFPRRTIISPVVPPTPPELVTWVNDVDDPVEWVNDDDDSVGWENDWTS